MPASRLADVGGQAVAAGVGAAVVGYAGSVAVVVAGLTAVGASPGQVATALLALGVGLGVTSVLLSATTRVPVAVVWSTPGLALLVGVGEVPGGLPGAVGALVAVGVALALTGLVPALPRLLARLPAALTSAVLAGVLLPFCLTSATVLEDRPLEGAVLWVAWLAALRWAPRFAGPAVLAALVVVVAAGGGLGVAGGLALPVPEVVVPTFSVAALLQVALPVYLVTMAAQNLVGAAVLASYGYRPPVGAALVTTGAASALLAPLLAPTSNLAAITGALTAGPEASPDPARRWVAAASAGVTHVVLGLLAPVAAVVVTRAPADLVTAAAGLALLTTFAASAAASVRDDGERLPAALVLLVTASGASLLGLGSAPVALLGGLLVRALLRRGGRRPSSGRHAAPGRRRLSRAARRRRP